MYGPRSKFGGPKIGRWVDVSPFPFGCIFRFQPLVLGGVCFVICLLSRWWLQIWFLLTPNLGEMIPILTNIFENWLKPLGKWR